jgi:hypothetical protein
MRGTKPALQAADSGLHMKSDRESALLGFKVVGGDVAA